MPKWDEITQTNKYQNLPPEAKAEVKTEWFKANLLPEIDKRESLREMGADRVYEWFMQQPDDTGQGYVTSMLGSAGRGFGEMVPGAIEGIGALTGSEGLREFGQDVRGGLESISPVNPIYAEGVPAKLLQTAGQVGSVLATAGAGGLAGKALGGVGAATKGMQAATLGSAFLQGSAEGAREAEQYGMTGPEAYLRTLAGGAIEAGTEFLPFGMTAETALAKRMLTGAPRTGTFLGAVGSEAGEEGLGQIASNLTTQALAPAGVETPGITEGALEAAAYGAFGGGIIGGVNALIPTPPERQTQIQKDRQAEFGDIPQDTVPDQTNEEKIAAMNAGGVTVVDPDGKTAVILPEPEKKLSPSLNTAVDLVSTAATNPDASQAVKAASDSIAIADEVVSMPRPEEVVEAVDETPALPETPEALLSEGAERNRAVIAEAAAKLRGEAPQDISAGLQAAIPPQPVETQENAIQEQIPDEGVLRQERPEMELQGVGDGNVQPEEVAREGEVQEEVITPPVEPTTATEGMVTPGGVATERDLTKPEQMTPEEFVPIGNPVNQGIFKSKKEASARLAELEETISKSQQMKAILAEFGLLPQDAYQVAKDSNGRWSLGATHKHRIALAAKEKSPVSAAAVDTYGIKLPEGYVKQGDLYVFQPQVITSNDNQTALNRGRLGIEPPSLSPKKEVQPKGNQEDAQGSAQKNASIQETAITEQPSVKAPPEGKKSLYQIRAAKGRPVTDADDIPTGWKLNEFRDAIELVSDDASKYVVFPIENQSSYGDKMRALIMAENWAIDNPVRVQIEAAPMEANYGAGRVEDVTPKTVKFIHTTKTTPGKGRKSGYYPGTYAYESESGLLSSMEGNKFVGELPESDIYTLKDADQLKKDAADAGFGRHSGNGNSEVKYLQFIGFKAMRRPAMGGTEIIVFDTKDANFQPQTTKAAAETQTPESVGRGLGGSRGVQSELAEGSIPAIEEVSTETETTSTEKSPIVESAMSYLMDDLTEGQKKKWTPEMFAAAEAYFKSGGKDFESLQKVVKFPRVVSQAYLKADKAASDEQAAKDKAQRITDAEIAKAEREEKKAEAEMLRREEMRSKSIDSIIGVSEKKKRKFGQVTNSDAIAAVAMLVSSKDVPGVLSTWWGTKEDFLRDPANQAADPEIYARIKAGELVEGFFNKGRAYVFLDGIGVSEEDMLRGEQMDVSPQIAAVRRVLLHESLVHRGIHGLPPRHRRLILNWVKENSAPEELDELAKLYTEYSNWRTSAYQFEALAEEFLAKKVDSLTEIPKDGPMAKLMDILRQIWDFIVGYKREPTLSDLKSVLKLLKSGAEAAANDRLKDGGEVKLSMIAPTAGVTPEMDAEYLAAVEAGDMAKAQRMVDEAASKWNPNSKAKGEWYHRTGAKEITEFYPWTNFGTEEQAASVDLTGRSDGTSRTYKVYLDIHNPLRVEDQGMAASNVIRQTMEQGVISSKEYAAFPFNESNEVERDYVIKLLQSKGYDGLVYSNEWEGEGDSYITFTSNQIKSADPVTRDDAGNVIPLSQRFQTTSPDIRFSRSEFASDTSAAFTAGSEAARSTIYSERDMDIREAIRRAYEAMPKTNSVAVPIGGLYSKTKELMPDVSETEFGNVLQDLFEDNGAVLQEGEVVEPLTEQDRRYLALTEDEDANLDELQRMVDEAAKAAGLNVSGVGNGITYEVGDEPDSVYGERDNVMSHGGTFGFYFSDNPDVWSDYAKPRRKGEKGRVNRTFLSLKKPFRFSKEFVSYDEFQTLLRDGGIMLPVEVKSRLDRLVAGGFGDTQPVWKWLHPTHVGAGASYGESMKKAFTDAGYDGVIHPDSSLIEGGLDTPATSYVVFSPSQIKSADPVTRDDSSNVIPLSRRFDTGADIRGQINVTTPEGKRAGFVVVMPRTAKASKIPSDAAPVKGLKDALDAINSGSVKAGFGGRQFKDFKPIEHTVKPTESYEKASIAFINDMLGEGYSLEDIADAISTPSFIEGIGIRDDLSAQDAIGLELRQRVNNELRKEKSPTRKYRLEKLNDTLSALWQGIGTKKGQHLAMRLHLQQNPRYRWMFLQKVAQDAQKKDVQQTAETYIGDEKAVGGLREKVNADGERAREQAGDAVADSIQDNQDAIDLAAGEETLNEENKTLWNRVKDWLREIGAAMNHIKSMGGSSKASLSAAQRSEISKMSKEEALAFIEDRQKKINKALKTLLGEESSTDTPAQKTTRAKRKKMVDTAKKRAEAGKDIEITSIPTQSFIDGLMTGYTDRKSIIDEVGDALAKAAEQLKAKPKQRTAIQDLVSSIKQTLMANIKGDKVNADQPSLGMLLGKTFAQQGSEPELFAKSWSDGRKKVRVMLAEMGVDESSLDSELDAIMPPTPTLAYAPAAAKKAINTAMRESGLSRSDLINDPTGSKMAIMERFDEAAKSANLTKEGWDNKGRSLAEKAVDESIMEAKQAREKSKKIAKIVSEQADNPQSIEDFGKKLAPFGLKKDKVSELFNSAKKLAEKKIKVADETAVRLLFEAENKLAQSAFFNATGKPDTIVRAFREQVENPMERDAFIERLGKMKVSEELAGKLFDKAAREKDNLQWKRAQDILEGQNALKNILRELNKARPSEQSPLSKQIPWRTILSQKAKTAEEYRQRIFDAVSSNEAFQNITDEQKNRLADLLTEAWETKRTEILDGMLSRLIQAERAANRITLEGAKALQEQRMKLVEDVNLGILDNDRLMKHLAEKFGIKSEFTPEERAEIDRLIDILQDDSLNRVKRNKAAYDFLRMMSATTKVPIAKLLADLWVTNVLSGMNTAASIALAVGNGAFELLSGVYRILAKGLSNPSEVPAEIMASFKSLRAFLSAFPREANKAWQYLVTGDVEFLDPSMNDALSDLTYENIGRSVSLAEQMAKSPKLAERVIGIWMRTVSRLLTALDSFNSGVTKAGSLPIVARQIDINPAKIAEVEKAMDLKVYKDRIIREELGGKAPTTAREKARLDSWAQAEMMAELDKFGEFTENADFFGTQAAMTLDPSGLGGMFYRQVKGIAGGLTTGADKFLAQAQREWKMDKGSYKAVQLATAYALQFIAYNSANLAGLRFARFAGNKFNQGLSFIPLFGALRQFEAQLDKSHIKGEQAFIDSIMRNQLAGILFTLAGMVIISAISDEPDDEKRGWSINGGWANLTPEKKQQLLSSGQKEFTIRIGDKVYSYQNWPISSILASIGGLSDLIRFSPEQWNEKSLAGRLASGAASGVFAATEIPALSGFQTLFGNNLSSKDPNEKKMDRLANVMAGWGGGFVPRILKDFDYLAEPELRKYETLWEKAASHIPVYRRYEGKEYYDILGKQIERNVYPGSREFMEKPSEPEYRILGALNSRGIWLTPANAEHRMVGKGRNKRKLTQEEADEYSAETGRGYRQMILRYGNRALQMPTERARAFLLDKADDVRDKALKKVYRGYNP